MAAPQSAQPQATLSVQLIAKPRYVDSEQTFSSNLPLLGVAPVPQKGWLYSGSGLSLDALYHPKAHAEHGQTAASTAMPASTTAAGWLDHARLHLGVGYSDAEEKWVADHAFVELGKGGSQLKIGRFAPFAQPKPMGTSSLLLASLVADDHWHVDGVQLTQQLIQNDSGSLSATLGSYREGAYLGDTDGEDSISKDDGGTSKQTHGFKLAGAHFATAHAQVAWQNTGVKPTLGVSANVLHAPDVVRTLSLSGAAVQTHTHGSALAECARASSTCFDGGANLLWVHGFWRQGTQDSRQSKGGQQPLYGVDAVLAAQQLSGDINTPITTLDTTSRSYHLLTDVFYQPQSTKYTLRFEALQIEHDIQGALATGAVKTLGLENNHDNPWRVGAEISHPLHDNIQLVTSATYDHSGDSGDMLYALGLDIKWHHALKIW